jgi:hypothetical protein
LRDDLMAKSWAGTEPRGHGARSRPDGAPPSKCQSAPRTALARGWLATPPRRARSARLRTAGIRCWYAPRN